jgi:hypothetical protein
MADVNAHAMHEDKEGNHENTHAHSNNNLQHTSDEKMETDEVV